MTTRDIEFILRARDEGKAVVEGSAATLDKFTKAQEAAAAAALKTGANVDRLSKDLSALGAKNEAIQSLDKFAQKLQQVETRSEALAKSVLKLAQDEAAAGDRAKEAANKHSELETRLKAAQAALKADGDAAAAAKVKYAELNAEMRKAQTAQTALQNRKVPRDAGKAAGLESDRAAALSHLDLMKAKASAAAAEFEKLATAKKAAAAVVAGLQKDTNVSSTNVSSTTARATAATTAASAARQQSDTAAAALGELRAIAEATSAALGGVAIRQKDLRAASAATAEQIKATTAALAAESARVVARPNTAPATGASAIRRLSDYRNDQENLSAARNGVADARAAYAAAAESATALGRAVATSIKPSVELTNEFNAARVASDAAKKSYEAQAAALTVLTNAERARVEMIRARVTAEQNILRQADAHVQARSNFNNKPPSGLQGGQADAHVQARASLNNMPAPPQADAHVQAYAKNAFDQGHVDKAMASLRNLRSELSSSEGAIGQLSGKVMGLIAAYMGFHAVVTQLHAVIETIRVMDAAQNRLGVVFEGDLSRTTQEVTFLSAQANRLGISFGTLVDQYSRVSLAAKEVGASTQQTRHIFMSFAETGRVAKLSTSEMQRMFLAIDEMMSRGKIQAKELRQLSYTIAGAPEIMAKSLGMTMAELTKAMKGGEVDASVENLMKIADGLQARYGAQLPEALQTTTTEMGRLQNSVFEAQASFAEGGFSEGLKNLLHAVNEEANKPETRQFFRDLGAGAKNLIESLIPIVPHLTKIAAGLATIVTIWASVWAVGKILAPIAAITRIGAAFVAARAAVAATTGAVGGLMVALRIGVSFVPILGQIVTGLGLAYAAYSLWQSKSKAPVEINALAKNKEHLVEIQKAFEDSGKSLDGWKERIKNVDLGDLEKTFTEIKGLFDTKTTEFNEKTIVKFKAKLDTSGLNAGEMEKFNELVGKLKSGETTFTKMAIALREMREHADSDKGAKFLSGLLPEIEKMALLEDQLAKSAAIAKEFGSKLAPVGDAVKKYGVTVESIVKPHDEVAEAKHRALKAAEAYKAAMDRLTGITEEASAKHTKYATVLEAVKNKYLAIKNAATDAQKAMAEAEGDKAIKAATEAAAGIKKTPEEEFEAQFGPKPEPIIGSHATKEQRAETMKKWEEDNRQRAEAGRRQKEADALKKQQDEDEKAKKKAEKKVEDQKKFDNEVDSDIRKRGVKGTQEEELGGAKRDLAAAVKTGIGVDAAQSRVNEIQREQAIQKAVDAEVEKAKTKELTLDDARLNKLREIAAAEYDAAHAGDAQEQAKKRLEEAEKRLGDLIARRKALEESIAFAKEHPGSKSPAEVSQLQAELVGVTGDARTAADEAERLARNLGDRKAVDNIRNQRDSLREFNKGLLDMKEVKTDFANGLMSGFEKISVAIGNGISGTKKWGDAWRDLGNALRMIAGQFLLDLGKMMVKKALFNALGLDEGKGGKGGKGGLSTTGGGLFGSLFGSEEKTASGGSAPAEAPRTWKQILLGGDEKKPAARPRSTSAPLYSPQAPVTNSSPPERTTGAAGELTISEQEKKDLAKTLNTEWVQSAGPEQGKGIIDTILNRKKSGKWGDSVTDVVDARKQFSDINGPVAWKQGRHSVADIPDSVLETAKGQKAMALTDSYLKERADGAGSIVGGHLNYANPKYSDAKNLAWINKLNGPRLGKGDSVHHHGTVDGYKPVDPNYKVVLDGSKKKPAETQVAKADVDMEPTGTIPQRMDAGNKFDNFKPVELPTNELKPGAIPVPPLLAEKKVETPKADQTTDRVSPDDKLDMAEKEQKRVQAEERQHLRDVAQDKKQDRELEREAKQEEDRREKQAQEDLARSQREEDERKRKADEEARLKAQDKKDDEEGDAENEAPAKAVASSSGGMDGIGSAMASGISGLGKSIKSPFASLFGLIPKLLGMLPKLFSGLGGMLGGLFGGGAAGGAGGGLFSGIGSLFGFLHSGGMASDGSSTKSVHPSVFNNAVRMHTGGIAGLGPNEVPRILEKTEEVLTKGDPRHVLNGGKAGRAPAAAPQRPVNIVNVFDPGDAMKAGLAAPHGADSFMNFVKDNAESIKGIIG